MMKDQQDKKRHEKILEQWNRGKRDQEESIEEYEEEDVDESV